MSVSPINPQDHSIDGKDVLKVAMDAAGTNLIPLADDALIEAIHQTFERDATPQEERVCKNCGDAFKAGSATVEQVEAGDFSMACCMNPCACDGVGCDLSPEECDHFWFVDPDTEIDRMARLIVDGEYRRRSREID